MNEEKGWSVIVKPLVNEYKKNDNKRGSRSFTVRLSHMSLKEHIGGKKKSFYNSSRL